MIESVRAATLEELAKTGFADLTMERVARAAGVNRTTLYRRWPSKAALLAYVVEPLLEKYDSILPTESLYEDLFRLMEAMRENAARPEGRALFAAIGQQSADLAGTVEQLSVRTLAAFHRLFAAGLERGEVSVDDDRETAAHLAFYGVGMWELTYHRPAADEDLHRILRAVLAPFGQVRRRPSPR
ncbi:MULTISPECIES: TetR/AcrR family transcriptional regulator [unclassified Arthrobacter]|uniref:TetR/AcrR family transcriptional regulator n=1 Tax=unclassified Arthrobacter TaxID=235627 RepID=UPI001D14CE9D|nr:MULTISPECIES: TetR/AcrR family transcriptional regulator [unclassified Arthrobacter]MCC3274979.1 TetR/AcrR family transcriptional regulator [Arthrobacter sp. zg-Y20]MCC9177424.1 TetR/AcrR family transcriptional regulator [Arthrobacter sp. zg-Y750]MDK1315136.1 TetR/AcrR family transcriptional regulator [Arthrobacter sp. zg.Y20]WIB04978.1 TetR/AcrR family transcriptional regulator [Arthrobacter sp. zg-Y20]